MATTSPAPELIPYGAHAVDEDDIAAVCAVLRSKFLTTGPLVGEFEEAFKTYTGAVGAVAVCNGTAALHAAVFALDICKKEQEVIVPPLTFCSTANVVLHQGASVRFADLDPETLCICPESVAKAIVPGKTVAVIAVDYGGQPCDYDALRQVCDPHGVKIIADASHSYGATYKGRQVGTLADVTTFSFHPVKNITTGEGGMVMVATDEKLTERAKYFRAHGINSSPAARAASGKHFYEMVELGLNYRLTDIQCALGIGQLKKLPQFLEKRREIAARYDAVIDGELAPYITRVANAAEIENAYHLYVIRVHGKHFPAASKCTRDAAFGFLRDLGIGVNVHYPLVHKHPFWREYLAGELEAGNEGQSLTVAEAAYEEIISMPMFPKMTEEQIARCVDALRALKSHFLEASEAGVEKGA